MGDNLRHWNKLCAPPDWAIKPIQAGRLKGKSDINPQWRMMAMTEAFGPCGEGWKYTIDKLWTEQGCDSQVMAFALVAVSIREGEGWSAPIPGIGGSMLIEKESKGLYTSDEGYKMAVTDALSVAFKALGVAANIYSGDRFTGSKYQREQGQRQSGSTSPAQSKAATLSETQQKYLPRVKAALDTLHGTDVVAKKATVKRLTTFTNDEGKVITGVEDYRTLDGKRLQILAQTAEKEAAKKSDTPE